MKRKDIKQKIQDMEKSAYKFKCGFMNNWSADELYDVVDSMDAILEELKDNVNPVKLRELEVRVSAFRYMVDMRCAI